MEKSFPCRQPHYSDTSKWTLSNPVIGSGQLNQTINAQQSTNQVREGHFCLKFFQPSEKVTFQVKFWGPPPQRTFYPSQLEGEKGKVDLARITDIKNYVKIFYPVAAVNIQSGRHKCCSQMNFFVGQLAKIVWETVRVFSGECTFYVLSPCSNRNNNAMCKFNTFSISLENGNMYS